MSSSARQMTTKMSVLGGGWGAAESLSDTDSQEPSDKSVKEGRKETWCFLSADFRVGDY